MDVELTHTQASKDVAFNTVKLGKAHESVGCIELSRPTPLPEDTELTGLATIIAVKKTWNIRSILLVWAGAFLVSTLISYDQNTYAAFQPYAVSEFGVAPLLSTITVVQSVIASVMQQPVAKLADVYGRFELFCTCVLIATIGEVLLASAQNLQAFAGAQVFFTVGTLGLHLLLWILAGDSSDLRNRAIMNIVPYAPALITSWTSSSITSVILKHTTWRWGYGAFAILFPIVSLPLLGTLFYHQRKARKQHGVVSNVNLGHHWLVFQKLDPVGLVLFSAGLSLLLIPMTLAASKTSAWGTPENIAMIAVGFVCLVVFVAWQLKWARYPLVPLELLKTRTVLVGISVAVLDYASWYSYAAYLYSYCIVARNLSPMAATNMTVVIPFTAVVGQICMGFVVKYVGRYKWIVVSGLALKILGVGLLLKYSDANSTLAAFVVSLVLHGLGEGSFVTLLAGMQASVAETFMASTAALFITSCGVGSAIGAAISGGIWTNILLQELIANLPVSLQEQLPVIYGSIEAAAALPWGSSEREAVDASYDGTFRILIVVSLSIACVELLAALVLPDYNLKIADKGREYGGKVIGKVGGHDTNASLIRRLGIAEDARSSSLS